MYVCMFHALKHPTASEKGIGILGSNVLRQHIHVLYFHK